MVKLNRYPKMAIFWYVIGRTKMGMEEQLAKAYGIWKATFYAAAKMGYYARGRKVAEEEKGEHVINLTKEKRGILRTPCGDAIEYSLCGNHIILYFGKRKKQEITADMYDRKVIMRFPDRRFYEEYIMFVLELIKDKPVHYFRSKWYKDLWCKIRDLDWAQQLHIVVPEAM